MTQSTIMNYCRRQHAAAPYRLLGFFLFILCLFGIPEIGVDKKLSTFMVSTLSSSKKRTTKTTIGTTSTSTSSRDEDDLEQWQFQSSRTSSSSTGGIATDWWSEYVPKTSRVFMSWNGTTPYGWCISSNDTTRRSKIGNGSFSSDSATTTDPISGLIYIKLHKASSSTSQGITANIAHHIGRQKKKKEKEMMMVPLTVEESETEIDPNPVVVPCTYYSSHRFANLKGHGRPRQRETSLLWTMVRHPAARDLSGVLYVNRNQRLGPPSEELILQFLSRTKFQGKQMRYLLPTKDLERMASPDIVRTQPERVADTIRNYILNYYDFIGVTERMNDSLAVMTLLWGLDAADVIVLSSKRSGGYDISLPPARGGGRGGGKQQHGGKKQQKQQHRKHQCVIIPKANRTTALEEYLQSEQYRSGHADFLLYNAVVASLDRTIDQIGRDIVENRSNLIQQLQEKAESQCTNVAKFPCSPIGEPQFQLAHQSCYVEDSGCGHECVDKVLLQQ